MGAPASDKEKNDRRKGLAVSITVHALLLLILAFVGLSHTIPPPEEGMLVNFGFDEVGLGEIESEPVASAETVQAVEPTQQATAAEEQVLTQDVEESVVAPKKADPRPEPPKQPTEEEIRRREQEKAEAEKRKQTEALFAKAKSGTGTGQGNTRPGGNQGDPDGVPGAPYGSGGGSGNGPSFNLSGRKMLAPPQIKDNSQKQGRVVVDIVVDKSGKVVVATPGGRGSTTTDSYLYTLARQAAIDTRFSASPDALQQKGTITFDFVVE
jgi:protein TonB